MAGTTETRRRSERMVKIEPAQALEEVELLPKDYYTQPVNLTEVTTLDQRLLQADFQPICASQLHPCHKNLLIKRSLRCWESQVLLTLTNPVENLTHLSLMPCEGDPYDITSTAKKELVLAGKDATAEYDELAEPQNFQDDPDVVAFRKANKVGVFIKVTPLQEKGKVIVSFKLKPDFRNQPTPIRPTEDNESGSEAVWVTHHMELDLGPVVPAAP